MHFILKMAGLVLSEISGVVGNQVFWVLIIVVWFLYKKTSNIEFAMLKNRLPLMDKMSSSLFNGFIGGLFGSFLVVLLGITIETYMPNHQGAFASGFTYIWIIAILMAMIHVRYLCFSYAGGLVALVSLIFGFPNVYVPGLMALVGILHLIESFLIWIDGHSFSVPIFVKKSNGKIVGGYIMNRMWPIPLVLTALAYPLVIGISSISGEVMPSWWPLLTQQQAFAYAIFFVPVVLGYGDIALTQVPEQRCRKSAYRLAAYSVILIILSITAAKLPIFAFAAALFAPVAHEALIIWGKREEEEGKPLYDGSGEGICVLYTRENSPARKMHLEPGDRILSINNQIVYSENQLMEFLGTCPTFIWLEIRRPDGSIKTLEYQNYREGIKNLGILIVPRNAGIYFEINDGASPGVQLYNKLFKKNINISK
ncbi:MAG TPA: PDZ domain-containing protein [Patescibacteria group bacterium]|nr:PDZ domain-containing protein [Patescibacteria group bacterium]